MYAPSSARKDLMNNNTSKKTPSTAKAKGGFWSIFLFYFFVAFEFAYMAGPFAIYFYSLYSPILNFFNRIPALAWLIKFFLPHVVRETSSPVLSAITVIGIIFALLGFLIFVIGACQIYYSKLTKKGAVTGGLYKFIRHPQYTSFIVCSFGLMLLWPRYIVVIFFVLLVFGYYFLARAEERECEAKFGESFIEYERTTGRFFPRLGKGTSSITQTNKDTKKQTKLAGFVKTLVAFVCTLAILLGGAYGLNELTLHSLYAKYSINSATVCLSKIDSDKLNTIIDIARNDGDVQPYLAQLGNGQACLNYVMPTEWFAAEIPMNGVVYKNGHKSPQDYNPDTYKIIFQGANVTSECPDGKDILKRTQSTTPLVEVWVDVKQNIVTDIKPMPEDIKYNGIPEAIY